MEEGAEVMDEGAGGVEEEGVAEGVEEGWQEGCRRGR